jgi:hypothetical protein
MLESESSALPFGDTPRVIQFVAVTTATNDIITYGFTFCKPYFYFFLGSFICEFSVVFGIPK